jgi:hypothetical protein
MKFFFPGTGKIFSFSDIHKGLYVLVFMTWANSAGILYNHILPL